jgi:hypothetical protein
MDSKNGDAKFVYCKDEYDGIIYCEDEDEDYDENNDAFIDHGDDDDDDGEPVEVFDISDNNLFDEDDTTTANAETLASSPAM